MKTYFITGIGTGVGKTIVSACLVQGLEADYWKPIQAGLQEGTDTEIVKSLVSNKTSVMHKERFRLNTACSPHLAAKIDGVSIQMEDLLVPASQNKTMVIEGAGGLLVPINDHDTILDLIKYLNVEVILVVKNYLGSINHSLLTIEVLKHNRIKVTGIVISGNGNPDSEKVIEDNGVKIIGRIPLLEVINGDSVAQTAKELIRNGLYNIR